MELKILSILILILIQLQQYEILMRNSIKQISLYLLIASLTWLPIQVTFASAFVLSSNVATHNNSTPQFANVSQTDKVSQSAQPSDDMSHCKTMQDKKDCCSDGGTCSQMDHDCNHCVSFVTIAQDAQQKFSPQHYTNHNIYNQSLTGVTSLSAYRPPC